MIVTDSTNSGALPSSSGSMPSRPWTMFRSEIARLTTWAGAWLVPPGAVQRGQRRDDWSAVVLDVQGACRPRTGGVYTGR